MKGLRRVRELFAKGLTGAGMPQCRCVERKLHVQTCVALVVTTLRSRCLAFGVR